MAERAVVMQLGDGVFVRQAVDNITWADMGGGLVVVDALEEARLEGEVFKAMHASVGTEPVRYVVNTHMHYDHVALHRAFVRRGAKVVVQQAAAGGVEEGHVITFREAWRHEGERRRVEAHWVGECHTPEDSVVFFPDDSVLCTGDLFGWGLIPIEPFHMEQRERILDVYRRMIAFNARHVVPGHGPIATTAHLRRWVKYFEKLIENVSAMMEDEESRGDIKKALAPPDDMKDWWRFIEWKHEYNVDEVLRAF